MYSSGSAGSRRAARPIRFSVNAADWLNGPQFPVAGGLLANALRDFPNRRSIRVTGRRGGN
jgi:hypothetical protein